MGSCPPPLFFPKSRVTPRICPLSFPVPRLPLRSVQSTPPRAPLSRTQTQKSFYDLFTCRLLNTPPLFYNSLRRSWFLIEFFAVPPGPPFLYPLLENHLGYFFFRHSFSLPLLSMSPRPVFVCLSCQFFGHGLGFPLPPSLVGVPLFPPH